MKAALVLLLVSMSLVAAAQLPAIKSTATVTIEVKDPSGAEIPQAKIRIVPRDPAQKLETGREGKVSVELAPGGYDVSVNSPGFAEARKQINVKDSSSVTMKFVLKLRTYGGPVEVSASTTAEQQVFALEFSYWKAKQQSDKEKFESLIRKEGMIGANVGAFVASGYADDFDAKRKRGLYLEEFGAGRINVMFVENMAVTSANVCALWLDKEGRGEPQCNVLVHTWIRSGEGWKIVSETVAESRNCLK